MPYAIVRKDKTAQKAVRRIAAERAAAAMRAVDDTALAQHRRVHEMRKNVKKLRALLRLVRPVCDDYRAENAALREAGRTLSPFRDRDVIGAALMDLAAGAAVPETSLAPIRPSPAPDGAHGTPEDATARFAAILSDVRARIPFWQVEGDRFDAFRPGLERTWDAARKVAKAADRDASDAAVHLWRKRVKDHWYHATLLRPIWPEAMSAHVAAADDLGELLGNCGDLALTARYLDGFSGNSLAALLSDQATSRRTDMLKLARVRHARLFAEPARTLADRWEAWFDLWRR